MSKHMEIKHEVQKKHKTEFYSLLDEAMLSEKERAMMEMYYAQRKDVGYIADMLGYSKAGILRMHRKVLEKIESLL
nr:MAG TPA: RNA polymerase sigma factor [Bacteriophage sp.]